MRTITSAVAVGLLTLSACGGTRDDAAPTTTRPAAVTTTRPPATTVPRPSPEDVVDLAFGRLSLELTSTRIVPGEPGLEFGAPFLCATFSVTNVGTNNGSVDVTQLGATTPDGQLEPTSAGGTAADGSGRSAGVALVPGGTGTVDVCFNTDGKTGEFEIEYHPGGVARGSWTVAV